MIHVHVCMSTLVRGLKTLDLGLKRVSGRRDGFGLIVNGEVAETLVRI